MNKTRVLHVRVVGFSAPERQMLNSIFLLSVAPARQIGYKLWNPEAGVAPDMYLLDGDSESAVASWQATFASTSDRTLVVGAKNTDLGVASAARPLGLKVVGAMDRLAIALGNLAAKEAAAGHDVSTPAAGATSPTSATQSQPAMPKADQTMSRTMTGATVQQPALSASMNAPSPASSTLSPAAAASTQTTAGSTLAGAAAAALTPAAASSTMSTASATMTGATNTQAGGSASATPAASSAPAANAATPASPTQTAAGQSLTSAAQAASAMPSMTASAPAATVLPNVTLQPNVPPSLDKPLERSLSEKPVTEKTVDKILSEKPAEKAPTPISALQSSGVTPLSPSALSAAVAPSSSRASLRVVQPSPLAASLPSSSPLVARLADAPMQQSMPAAPVPKIAEAPMQPPPAVTVTVNPAATLPPPVPVMPAGVPTARHEEHNFRVLVVDDSPLMRTFMQNKLSPYGVQPEFAASGEEALFKISKQHFDLIFLDVMLPGMDGYDVCKMIKKNKDNHLMKVVMLTSKDKTFDKIRGTMAGCDGYLTKPVDEMKLRAIIERHSVSQK